MHKILTKKVLNEQVILMELEAPRVAKKCKPGQFVILRVNEQGERIPLTIADFDREKGTVTIIFQIVGKTTMLLAEQEENGFVSDIVGPLGNASDLNGVRKAAVIGGGLGSAIAYPQAKALHKMGAEVEIIAGFRTKDLVILEDEMRAVSDQLFVMTDDGSYGEHGLVTDKLKERIDGGAGYDTVIAIGPLIMMKFVAKLTKEYGIRTVVSMNPVMIDGTGMCGGCRVSVGGETKFACVDGPEFDGHLIDFDEVIRRTSMYREQEQEAVRRHKCRLEDAIDG
jgi:ferredoxin--NADP+ reductase